MPMQVLGESQKVSESQSSLKATYLLMWELQNGEVITGEVINYVGSTEIRFRRMFTWSGGEMVRNPPSHELQDQQSADFLVHDGVSGEVCRSAIPIIRHGSEKETQTHPWRWRKITEPSNCYRK